MSIRETPPKTVLGGRESVKIAIAQVPSAFLDRKKTITRACATIREAAQNGADLVVFPEVWVSGYPFWSEGWDSQFPHGSTRECDFARPPSLFRATIQIV